MIASDPNHNDIYERLENVLHGNQWSFTSEHVGTDTFIFCANRLQLAFESCGLPFGNKFYLVVCTSAARRGHI